MTNTARGDAPAFRLRSKHTRALKALRDGERMNASLTFALFQLPENLVTFDASKGSENIKATITDEGRALLSALNGESE